MADSHGTHRGRAALARMRDQIRAADHDAMPVRVVVTESNGIYVRVRRWDAATADTAFYHVVGRRTARVNDAGYLIPLQGGGLTFLPFSVAELTVEDSNVVVKEGVNVLDFQEGIKANYYDGTPAVEGSGYQEAGVYLDWGRGNAQVPRGDHTHWGTVRFLPKAQAGLDSTNTSTTTFVNAIAQTWTSPAFISEIMVIGSANFVHNTSPGSFVHRIHWGTAGGSEIQNDVLSVQRMQNVAHIVNIAANTSFTFAYQFRLVTAGSVTGRNPALIILEKRGYDDQ